MTSPIVCDIEIEYFGSKKTTRPTKNIWNEWLDIFKKVGWKNKSETIKFRREFGLEPSTVKQIFGHPGFFNTAWKNHCSSQIFSDEDLFLRNLYKCSRGASIEDCVSKFGGSTSFHSHNFYKVLEHNICFFKTVIKLPTYEESKIEKMILAKRNKNFKTSEIFIADGNIRPYETKNPNFYTHKTNIIGNHGIQAIVFVKQSNGEIIYVDAGYAPSTIQGQETHIIANNEELKTYFEETLKGEFSVKYDSGVNDKLVSFVTAIPKKSKEEKQNEEAELPLFEKLQSKQDRKNRAEIENVFGAMQQKFKILRESWKGRANDQAQSIFRASNIFIFCCQLTNIILKVEKEGHESLIRKLPQGKKPTEIKFYKTTNGKRMRII